MDMQGNIQQFDGFSLQGSKSHPGVRQGVHADPEPGHAIRTQDPDHGPGQNQQHPVEGGVLEDAEIIDHAGPDEDFEDDEELPLLDEVGLAGLENNFRDIQHGLVAGQAFYFFIFIKPKSHPHKANQETNHQEAILASRKHGDGQLCLAGPEGGGENHPRYRKTAEKQDANLTHFSLLHHFLISFLSAVIFSERRKPWD
jgi:hypothetical protein